MTMAVKTLGRYARVSRPCGNCALHEMAGQDLLPALYTCLQENEEPPELMEARARLADLQWKKQPPVQQCLDRMIPEA